jgi:hypothetical protein
VWRPINGMVWPSRSVKWITLRIELLDSGEWGADGQGHQQIGAGCMPDDNKPDPGARYWRYQAVRVSYREYPDDSEFVIIEVYLDRADDSLCAWSAEPVGKHPSGETVEELIADLTRMLRDAREWEPVDFADLRVGMRFERAEADGTAGRGFA